MIPYAILIIEDDDDREFMTQIFHEYKHLIYFEIKQMVSDDWTAEDILQDAIIKLIDKLSLLRTMDRRKLVSYIITTARNLCKNYYRDNSKASYSSLDDEDVGFYNVLESDVNIEEAIIHKESLVQLKDVWPRLNETNRMLLEMKYILMCTDQEIADAIGVKPSSVRMMLTRARKAAMTAMAGESLNK